MGMNYEIYKNRRTALIFRVTYQELPKGLAAWKIADMDAFHENLGMWCPDDQDLLEMFFSTPISGIPQHVANIRDKYVGVAGVSDDDMIEKIKLRYLDYGYDVVITTEKGVDFTESEPDNKVRIVWG